jgi:hypothetical protein
LLGGLPGFLLNLNNFLGYSTGQVGTAQQPLLWYRLLPNSTLGPGILPLMLLMTGPPVTLLIYRTVARTWKLDGWQLLAVWVALAGFLVAGLVISTKIGGGGDLHNLDMYIGTLMLVTASLLFIKLPDVKTWPAWALALLCLIPFLPAYQFTPFNPSANYHPWLDLPTAQQSAPVLEKIRSAVEDASRHGKVLFMDQRQLLTFGFVDAIPFVPEYEKKYMMDQALASNEAYFKPYYQDLANRRFDLIVTEPLRVNLKEGSGAFSEENDLWVTWVSAPTLCFYESIYTDRVVGVQLLVPRENPTDCGGYLQ